MQGKFDPTKESDIVHLRNAIVRSEEKLQPYRKKRKAFVSQYVGGNYSDDASPESVPVNLMEMAINIYSRQLMADNPRTMVNTEPLHLKPQAVAMELSLNAEVVTMNLRRSLRNWVMDGLFQMGIMLVGEDEDGRYAETIDFDDWFHDMSVDDMRSAGFMGHKYRVPLWMAQENEQFGKVERESLQSTDSADVRDAEEDIRELSRGEDATNSDDYQPVVALMDIWLPEPRLILTVPCARQKTVLRIREFDGPKEGPYHLLRYETVPGQIMPLPLASIAMDLHLLANELFLKLADQAQRQKTITVVRDGSAKDGEAVVGASDGETIFSADPNATKEMKFGGIAQENLAFFLQVRQLFSYLLGNLDAIGGLGAQSETLGQDEMLAEAASKRVSDMQDVTVQATQGVMRALAWYEWHDPFLDKKLKRPLPDFPGLTVDMDLTADNLLGEFPDYLIEIDPYSLRDKTPGSELQVLDQVMMKYVMPLMPLMQQQGMMVDVEALLKLVAKRTGFTDLQEIITFGAVQDSSGQNTQPAGKSPTTHRIQERINRPGGTRNGQEAALTQTLMGGRAQDSEMDAVGRSAS